MNCGQAYEGLSVLCSLEAEITAPRKNVRPGAGSISFSLDFLPMAHPSMVDPASSSDSELEQCLNMLESLYRDTYCIDFETLCIEINKLVDKTGVWRRMGSNWSSGKRQKF